MPFIRSYNGAMKQLASIGTGKCSGACKSSWIRIFRYSVSSKTNPLGLNKTQRKAMTEKIRQVSGRQGKAQHAKTLKRFAGRPSPPLPANDYCGQNKKGNDGKMYESRANVAGVCSWKPVA